MYLPEQAGPGISRRQTLVALGALGGAGLIGALARSAEARQGGGAEAPATLQNVAGSYSVRLGNLELSIIGDGNGSFPAYPIFGSNTDPANVGRALESDFLPADMVTVAFNVPLIRTGKDVILIDAGNGPKSSTAGRLAAHMANLGVKPEQVTGVIVSHLHGDHYGGLTAADGSLAFPNARYFMQKSEHDFWTGPAPDLSRSKLDVEMRSGMIKGAAGAADKLKGKLELLDGEKELAPGVKVEPAPGHTPGHQMVHLSGGGREILMVVDCVHHHCLSFRHPEWHLRFDADADKGVATRKRVLDRAATDRALVLTYHLPFPGLGHVRKQGEGFEWVPAGWEW